MWRLVMLITFATGLAHAASAAPPDDAPPWELGDRLDRWGTPRNIVAIAQNRNTVYFGGDFSEFGLVTGGFVRLDAVTGKVLEPVLRFDGGVFACVSDGDGGWYLGGSFSSVSGVPRNNAARILRDGTLDPGWNPDVQGSVRAMALHRGEVLLAGSFTEVGGMPRKALAAVRADNAGVLDWEPGVDSDHHYGASVEAMVVDGDTLYLTGEFNVAAGRPRTRLAAFNLRDKSLRDWDPWLDKPARCLAASEGTLYVGGDFQQVGSVRRRGLAAINCHDASVLDWNPDQDASVFTLLIDGGRVYAGGYVWDTQGSTCHPLVTLDRHTGEEAGPRIVLEYGHGAHALARSKGRLLMAGGYYSSNRAGFSVACAAFDPENGRLEEFGCDLDSLGDMIASDDSVVVVGGRFRHAQAKQRVGLAAVSARTGELASWSPTFGGESLFGERNQPALSSRTDRPGAPPRSGNVVRASMSAAPAGLRLASFPFRFRGRNSIDTLAATEDAVYLGGDFTEVNGQPRRGLAAVHPVTGETLPWRADADHVVRSIVVSESRVFVTGIFKNIADSPRDGFAALDRESGRLLEHFPRVDGEVRAILPHGDTVFIGGDFSRVGTEDRCCLAALDERTGEVLPLQARWDDYDFRGVFFGAMAMYGNALYFNVGRQLMVLDLSNGKVVPAATWLSLEDMARAQVRQDALWPVTNPRLLGIPMGRVPRMPETEPFSCYGDRLATPRGIYRIPIP